MARWKRWTMLAGALVSLVGSLTPAFAQGPGYQPLAPQNQPTEPIGLPTADEFPRLGAAPAPQQGPPPHPMSLEERRGEPNGFSDEETYRQPVPYVLKIKGEYMLWRLASPNLSATVATTSSSPNLANGVGALGDPGTSSLLGPGSYGYGTLQGTRLTAGVATGFLPPIEISGFWTGTSGITLLNQTSDGSQNSPVLARPYQATNLPDVNGLGQELVALSGFPGVLAGNITVTAKTSLWGIETNAFFNLGESDVAGLDVIVGYRFQQLQETLDISSSMASVNSNLALISFNSANTAGFPQGFTSVAADHFQTWNSFNGGTIGLRPSLYTGIFTTTADLKLSMGSTHQTLNVSGESSLVSPNGSPSAPGGILALPSNSGNFERDVFTIIPELDINVGFNITRTLKVFATYNVFYWSSVVRPGDQLNNQVDSRQVPTDFTYDPTVHPTQPAPSFFTRGFWGQGFSLGLEIGF